MITPEQMEFEKRKLELFDKLRVGRNEVCIEPYDISKTCPHTEHEPARYVVRKPGKYKHTCPGCHKVTEFEIPLVTC